MHPAALDASIEAQVPFDAPKAGLGDPDRRRSPDHLGGDFDSDAEHGSGELVQRAAHTMAAAVPPDPDRPGPTVTTGHAPRLENRPLLADARKPMSQRLLDDLLSLDEERPVAEPWGNELAQWINEALGGHAGHIQGDRLFLGKAAISGLLGCEARHLGPREDFRWTPRAARGEIVHRAVAMALAGNKAESQGLVVAALDQTMASGAGGLSGWLHEQSEPARAVVVTEAIPVVNAFVAAWPPIKPAWGLITEYPVVADLAGGRIRVAGRVDLVLGANRVGHDEVLRRKRVFIELKTGKPNPSHRADHLLYALLETLRTGVAPWRSATYWLDEGTLLVDTITMDLLVVAARRLIDAVERHIELSAGRPPTRQPGWRCDYCALAQHCDERLDAEDSEWRVSGDR